MGWREVNAANPTGRKKGDPSEDKVALNVTTGEPGETRPGRTTIRGRGATTFRFATPMRWCAI